MFGFGKKQKEELLLKLIMEDNVEEVKKVTKSDLRNKTEEFVPREMFLKHLISLRANTTDYESSKKLIESLINNSFISSYFHLRDSFCIAFENSIIAYNILSNNLNISNDLNKDTNRLKAEYLGRISFMKIDKPSIYEDEKRNVTYSLKSDYLQIKLTVNPNKEQEIKDEYFKYIFGTLLKDRKNMNENKDFFTNEINTIKKLFLENKIYSFLFETKYLVRYLNNIDKNVSVSNKKHYFEFIKQLMDNFFDPYEVFTAIQNNKANDIKLIFNNCDFLIETKTKLTINGLQPVYYSTENYFKLRDALNKITDMTDKNIKKEFIQLLYEEVGQMKNTKFNMDVISFGYTLELEEKFKILSIEEFDSLRGNQALSKEDIVNIFTNDLQ